MSDVNESSFGVNIKQVQVNNSVDNPLLQIYNSQIEWPKLSAMVTTCEVENGLS